jgi:signal transduction histidine kinase
VKFGELIPLIGAVLNLALALLVLTNNFRSAVNRVYSVLGISFAIWNFGTFWMFRVTNAQDAYFWARFLQFGVIFIPVSFLHLSMLIARVRTGIWLIALYVLSVALALSNFTHFFISGVHNVGYAWYSVAGPGFFIVAGLFMLLWASIVMLINCRRKLPEIQRRRLLPLIIAQVSITLFGDNDILPILGIDYYPFTHIQIYPFGSMAAVFYGIIIGYSVLQYQLLDFQIAMGRVAAHIVRISFLCLVGLGVILCMTLIAPREFTYFSILGGMLAVLIGAITAAWLFPRLFGESGEGIERRILGDKFEYQDRIREFIESIQWCADTDVLLDEFNDLMVRTLRAGTYQMILRDEEARAFMILREHPHNHTRGVPELTSNSPVFRLFEITGAEYISNSSLYALPKSTELEKSAQAFLSEFNAVFCLPLTTAEGPFGLLLVGRRVDDTPYTATDISLLVTLVRRMSLIINQIRLKNQILQAQEYELLGRMSRGMAHDINNLVTPVQTLVQLIAEGVPIEGLRDELLPLATRSIETLREYIREALFFSENARPDMKIGRLDLLVLEAADIVAPRCVRKEVKVVAHAPEEVLVEMDKSLIKRTITNILANAIDASPERATVVIEVQRVTKPEKDRGWTRVRVIDTGEGIKPEDMDRIFAPYFTTKNRGDQQRGFGLGLSICRKVVQLHGGSLKVISQPNKGTTVQIDLPNQRSEAPVPAMAIAI